MLNRLMALVAGGAGLVATLFAGLWAAQKMRVAKEERKRLQETHDAITRAGERLEAARKTRMEQPIDTQRRTDFEKQP